VLTGHSTTAAVVPIGNVRLSDVLCDVGRFVVFILLEVTLATYCCSELDYLQRKGD
jgi:hypothetical protein